MMKIQHIFLFLVFILKHKVAYASEQWRVQSHSELDVYLQGFTFDSSKVNTIFECYRKCEQNLLCSTININLTDSTCEWKYSTKTRRHPEKTVRHMQNVVYMEARDDLGPPGSRPDRPIPSCKKLKEDDSQAKSGVYWMKFNEPSSAPFQVFCDMTTDGGGWTLVYSYKIARYSTFGAIENAVTPIPYWPELESGRWAARSREIPLSESSHLAMDFALWKRIGSEVLIKSSITNWVACVEGTGSLVNWVEGSVTCRIVKVLTSVCTTVTPNLFLTFPCGPGFFRDANDKHYIYLDGRRDRCIPIHDPCGTRSATRHLKNVPNPGGLVYLR